MKGNFQEVTDLHGRGALHRMAKSKSRQFMTKVFAVSCGARKTDDVSSKVSSR
jgi:hypothetical protein